MVRYRLNGATLLTLVSIEDRLKSSAKLLGFELVGIASAKDPALADDILRYRQWLADGYGASMGYLGKHADIKSDPNLFLSGAQSVIAVGLVYGRNDPQPSDGGGQISMYARGKDYHEVLGAKLSQLAKEFEDYFPEEKIQTKVYVDTAPTLDRFWAWRAGLGWLGKNTCLINRKFGSYIFLGGIFTTKSLVPDPPASDHCGRCTRCIDSCPTEAIVAPRVLDSNRCIAYHTVENRDSIPSDVSQKFGNWIVGCDVCQAVCPWNDPISLSGSSFLETNKKIVGKSLKELSEYTERDFKDATIHSSMNRIRYPAFLRNVLIAVENSQLSQLEKQKIVSNIQSHIQKIDENKTGLKALTEEIQKASKLFF